MSAEENSSVVMSNKEEEDNAWWSDYQASTKLKRKWKNKEESEQDNFDDLLGDLDSIALEKDTEKDYKSRSCELSPVQNSSRKSSTSGYDTLSSVCTTPEFKDTSESVTDTATSVGEDSRSSTPHVDISLSNSRDDCDILNKDDLALADEIKVNDNTDVIDIQIKESDKNDKLVKDSGNIFSDNDNSATFHTVIDVPKIYIPKDASKDECVIKDISKVTKQDILTDELPQKKPIDSSGDKILGVKGKKQNCSISKQVKNTNEQSSGVPDKNAEVLMKGKQETDLKMSKLLPEKIKNDDTIIEIKHSSALLEKPADEKVEDVELVNTEKTKDAVIMKKKTKEKKEQAKKTLTPTTKDNVHQPQERFNQEVSPTDKDSIEQFAEDKDAAKYIQIEGLPNCDNKRQKNKESKNNTVIINKAGHKSALSEDEVDCNKGMFGDLSSSQLTHTTADRVKAPKRRPPSQHLLKENVRIEQNLVNSITKEELNGKGKICIDKVSVGAEAVSDAEKLIRREVIDIEKVQDDKQKLSKDNKPQNVQEKVVESCDDKASETEKVAEPKSETVVVRALWTSANIEESSSMVSHWTSPNPDMYQPQSMKSLLSHYFYKSPQLRHQLHVSTVAHQAAPGGQEQNYTSMLAHNPVQPSNYNTCASTMVSHFSLTSQTVDRSMLTHHAATQTASSVGSMITHCVGQHEQNTISPITPHLSICELEHQINNSASSMVAHGANSTFAAQQFDHPSSLAHSSQGVSSKQNNSMVAHHILCNKTMFEPGTSILTHVAPSISINTTFGGNTITNLSSCLVEPCLASPSSSWIAHLVPIWSHLNTPLLGTLIPHYTPVLPYMESTIVGSFASHSVNSSQVNLTSPSEDKHLCYISVPQTKDNIIEEACEEIDIITCDVMDDTSDKSNTITNNSTTAPGKHERESQESGLDNSRLQIKANMQNVQIPEQKNSVGIREKDDISSDAISEQTKKLEQNKNAEPKVYETCSNSPHDSSSADIVDRTQSPQHSLVSYQDRNREGTITKNMSAVSTNVIQKDTLETENNILKKDHAGQISRSISLNSDPDHQEGLHKSISLASLKSEEGSLSGMESSLNNSLSSLITSPLPTRKPRPLVLRNHFSSVTNKQQEQKYLPAPRIRRTSEESVTKSSTPQLRRKARRSSGDTKISSDSANESSRQAQIGSLEKISSDEGENNSLSETIQPNSKKKTTQMKTEPSKIKAELELDMKKPVEVEKLNNLDVSLTSFMNFEFKYVGTKQCVQVAGTFNDWIPEDLYNNNDDVWSKNIRLPHGTFQFKYLVDGVWMHDPLYPTICDQQGIANNVIYVGETKRKDSDSVPKNTNFEAPESPTSVEEPIVGKLQIFLKSKEVDLPANHSKSGLAESNSLADGVALEGLVTKTADQAKTPQEVRDATQGLINNIYESKIAPRQEQLPKEKAPASEIALTTQNSIVSDNLSSVTNITSGDSNVEKHVSVKEPLADESLSTTHSCSMEISNRGGQETSEAQDLKKEIMGNSKSAQNAENSISNELLINVVNENIKKICLYPEYKASAQSQSIIKQVLDLVVNAGDPKELSKNIANEKLQIFLNPLSDAEIKKLCGYGRLGNDTSEFIITPQIADKDIPPTVTESKNQLKDIINENIRIVRKSPSYAHDQITQLSVKKVLEIIGNYSNDEEIIENLQDLSLHFFIEPEKSKFWLMKDENMDSCIVESNQEPQRGIVDKYLNRNNENQEIVLNTKELSNKSKVLNEESNIQETTESTVDKAKEGENKGKLSDNNTADGVKQSAALGTADKAVTVDTPSGNGDDAIISVDNQAQMIVDTGSLENSELTRDSTTDRQLNLGSSSNCLEDGAIPLSENLSSIVDKHLNKNRDAQEIISNAVVSEVYSAVSGNMAQAKEEKNEVMQNPTTKECSIEEKHLKSKEDIQNKESFTLNIVTDQNDVSEKHVPTEGTESIDTNIAFEETLNKLEAIDTSATEDGLGLENADQTVKGERNKDLPGSSVSEYCVESTENKESENQLKGEKDKEKVPKEDAISIIVTENEILQSEDNTSSQENFDEEAHQKEKERVNLVGIINKNISKYCKEKDYGKNETAQRKVRTIFNIITESISAEEIYDKIMLEGLQYFAEFHGDAKVEKKESVSASAASASPSVKHKEKSPSISKRNTETKDSIVSKILKEVNTPKHNRKVDPAISPKIKKSQTFAGEMKDENKEKDKLGKCSITRDKASRQVRKYVRTSLSAVNLDQLDQEEMKDSIENSENKESLTNENILKVKTSPSEAVEIQKEFSVTPDENVKEVAIEEPLKIEKEEKIKLEINENKDPSANENMVNVKTMPSEAVESENEIAIKLDGNVFEEPLNIRNHDEEIQEALSVNNTNISEHKSEDKLDINSSDRLGVNDKHLEIDISEDFSHSSNSNSRKSLPSSDREIRGLSIGNIERRQQSQIVQRSFADALKDSKDKKKNHNKKNLSDENSIVSRLLKEKGCSKPIENVPEKVAQINVKSYKDANIRDRTISECSDNLPDLCPITDDDDDLTDILDEELWQKIHKSEKESKDVKFSVDDAVESYDDEGRRNSIFMTDFDDEIDDSENESFADAEDKLVENGECLSSTDVIEPKIRTLLQNILTDVFEQKCCECSTSKTFITEEVEKIVTNLVTHILDLVEKLVDQKTTNNIEQRRADISEEREKRSESGKAFDTSNIKEVEDNELIKQYVDSESELEECETVYDVFDLSMKRLDFIEHSFKTIYTAPNNKEEAKPLAIERPKTIDFEDKLKQIREILTSQKDSDEKLKEIEDIVKESSPTDEKVHAH